MYICTTFKPFLHNSHILNTIKLCLKCEKYGVCFFPVSFQVWIVWLFRTRDPTAKKEMEKKTYTHRQVSRRNWSFFCRDLKWTCTKAGQFNEYLRYLLSWALWIDWFRCNHSFAYHQSKSHSYTFSLNPLTYAYSIHNTHTHTHIH